jgi:DNA ligase-1
VHLSAVVHASRDVAATAARNGKIERLAELLRRAHPDAALAAVSWLIGELPQGRIGLGPAAVHAARDVSPASDPTLSVTDVDAAFTHIAGMSGSGSTGARVQALRALLGRATADEQEAAFRWNQECNPRRLGYL